MNTTKTFLALMGATLLSANALADPEAPSLVAYDVNGDGTTADGEQAYKITSYDDLCWFRDKVNDDNDNFGSANAFLANDIEVNPNLLSSLEFDEDGNVTNEGLEAWFPIGYYIEDPYTDIYFDGTFDGQGYTICGLYFNNTNQSCVGLFGQIGGDAIVKNVGVIDSYFKGASNITGVCGYNDGGTIENCYNTGSVKGSGDYVGGVCGCNSYGTIENCYNTGEVNGDYYVGGVCGENYGAIENCYNTGEVNGDYYVGGVCGYNNYGAITNCYNIGSVKGSGDNVGGMCGKNYGTITNCYDFKVDGGTMGEYSIVINEGSIALPTDVTLVGKAFEGWYENDNYEGSAIVSEDAGFNEVHTLYAKYPAPTQITADNYDDYNLTEDYIGYYAIGDAYELYWFANYVNKGGENAKINGVLVDNIVVNENVLVNGALNTNAETVANFRKWFPIGYYIENPYTDINFDGTFDGQSYTICGLYFNNTNQSCVGLFGQIGGDAIVKNVGVIDSYFKGDNGVGSVCGYNDGGTIENCYNTGSVKGDYNVSGVCGYNNYGTITNCYNIGSVKGSGDYVGGMCGENYGTIENCYNTGEVSGGDGRWYIGGVCGYNGYGTIENCYNTGEVSGESYIGGVCGYNEYGNITNCYNTGEVSGGVNSESIGGVYGYNYGGTIKNCYNTGSVKGSGDYVGGMCGENYGTIENCYDFKVDGGTMGEYSIVINEGSIALPADVTLVGKAFEGWYENDNYEGSAIVSEDAGFEVHTLYAKWVENSTPTAIKAVETENNKTIKTIKDGQIVIIRNGVMYDMQGRKM